jgi:type IV secretion system protein VirB9
MNYFASLIKLLSLLILINLSVFSAETAESGESDLGIYKKQVNTKFRKKVIKAYSMGHDSRFKVFPFMENGVYEIVSLYDNTTYIEFESDEKVQSMTNPKTNFWQMFSKDNKLFIQPVASDADTQITVMTNKRTYFFEMYAKEPSDNFDENYTFYYQFNYPSEEEQKTIRRYSKSILPNIAINPEKYNFNYTVTGQDSLYPMKIFDDGEFTYFEFKEKGGIIPAIFLVDTNNYESLVNFRMVGNYLVVEAVSPRFTLRNGADIVCVFNENIYSTPQEKKGFFAKTIIRK